MANDGAARFPQIAMRRSQVEPLLMKFTDAPACVVAVSARRASSSGHVSAPTGFWKFSSSSLRDISACCRCREHGSCYDAMLALLRISTNDVLALTVTVQR